MNETRQRLRRGATGRRHGTLVQARRRAAAPFVGSILRLQDVVVTVAIAAMLSGRLNDLVALTTFAAKLHIDRIRGCPYFRVWERYAKASLWCGVLDERRLACSGLLGHRE